MESIAYVLLYFLKGKLPWMGIQTKNKKEKYEKIKQTKASTAIEDLCRGQPKAFVEYLTYVRNLKFEDLPNYKYLRGLFKKVMQEHNFEYDYEFDWVIKKNLKRKAAER